MPLPLKATLKRGESVLGIWSLIASPTVAEIMGIAGMDFQILDREHGAYDLGSLEAGIRTCESVECSPLVRVSSFSPSEIQSALDLGAHGILVPRIASADDVKAAIACMRYAPHGTRGFNPFTRSARYNSPKTEGTRLSDENILRGIIVEEKSACEEIDEILSIADLDLVYVGAYDLSMALGYAGNVREPQLVNLIENLVKKIRKAGKAAGMMVRTKADMDRALAIGATMLVWSVDTDLIRLAATGPVDAFRKKTGSAKHSKK